MAALRCGLMVVLIDTNLASRVDLVQVQIHEVFALKEAAAAAVMPLHCSQHRALLSVDAIDDSRNPCRMLQCVKQWKTFLSPSSIFPSHMSEPLGNCAPLQACVWHPFSTPWTNASALLLASVSEFLTTKNL